MKLFDDYVKERQDPKVTRVLGLGMAPSSATSMFMTALAAFTAQE